jgi:large subunit ribosomal protein L24
MLTIKKKDKVMVLTGKDKGKQGEVLQVYPEKNRVIVAKVNFVKRHTKPTQTEPGGIHQKESSIALANVMLICPKCSQKTRPKFDALSDGKKIRICRRCNEMIA